MAARGSDFAKEGFLTSGVPHRRPQGSSSFERIAKALDEAPSRGWLVVDLKNDWKVIFPPGDE